MVLNEGVSLAAGMTFVLTTSRWVGLLFGFCASGNIASYDPAVTRNSLTVLPLTWNPSRAVCLRECPLRELRHCSCLTYFSTVAPWDSRYSATWSCPLKQARWRGVLPLLFCKLIIRMFRPTKRLSTIGNQPYLQQKSVYWYNLWNEPKIAIIVQEIILFSQIINTVSGTSTYFGTHKHFSRHPAKLMFI